MSDQSKVIRKLAEEVVRELSEAGDWCEEDWFRDEHIGRWEGRIRAALSSQPQFPGELAVMRAALNGLCEMEGEIVEGAKRLGTYRSVAEGRLQAARTALNSDMARLATDLILAALEARSWGGMTTRLAAAADAFRSSSPGWMAP